ncbi:hypothetical protein BC834DRAFT_852822 [Gloeopeniophorella convolvens]|nr:hypothetical protein BC834DRAFT_852822 [Gloeopeniophorella convolvens]
MSHNPSSQELNPRPAKRQRKDSLPSPLMQPSSDRVPEVPLAPLPPHALLLALPNILAHPPTSINHPHALYLSLKSVRQCLALGTLSPEIECRAWAALAEIGMNVIDGGFSHHPDHAWAHGIESEVEKAISKGTLTAQKHPTLRLYKFHLTLLHARLSQWQHNTKFARILLRRLLDSFQPHDPPSLIYVTNLALIHHFHATQDHHGALNATRALQSLAEKNGHIHVSVLAHVLHLQSLISAAQYAGVPAVLESTERALGLSFSASQDKESAPIINVEIPVEGMLVAHALILGIIYYAHEGNSPASSPRLSYLHALLDSGVLDAFPDGIVSVPFASGPPLAVRMTHPRVLFFLGFLTSSVAKRDGVGRKPKKKVFTVEGLAMFDKLEAAPPLSLPSWSSKGDLDEIEQSLDMIKADLLSELTAVSIMRSEFDTAEEALSGLIAHTRTTGLFSSYSPRITLHHAHLAHALGQSARAATCYRVAAALAEADNASDVRAAALAGDAGLQLGLLRSRGGGAANERVIQRAHEAAEACRGLGGTLEAVGEVLEACLSVEIIKSKQHLKRALSLASAAQDNHLRALILALVAAHYVHTAGTHARGVLGTAAQLAAGLGAGYANEPGNAPLRLWLGERLVELYRREGKEDRIPPLEAVNAEMREAVAALAVRAGA